MKSFKTLISMIVFGVAMAPAVQAESTAGHYLYLTLAQDGEDAHATMSSNVVNLEAVDCTFSRTVCEAVGLIPAEGVAYYPDQPAAYEVTEVMEVGASPVRIAETFPIGADDIVPGVGPIGPVDPRKDLLEVLEALLGEHGTVTLTYEFAYHVLIRIAYTNGETVITVASNVLNTSCNLVDNQAPWCRSHVKLQDPPDGTVYYTDKVDAYEVKAVIEDPHTDRRTAVTVPILGDDIVPGVGPIGPVDPRRFFEELIGEINGVLCSQLQCEGQPIDP